jgi:hypothetical protein
MAVQLPSPKTQLLTYEEYMAEEEIALRYDIVDGVREFMSAPTWQHQRIQFNASTILRRYEEASGNGFALGAPFDLLLSRVPCEHDSPTFSLLPMHGWRVAAVFPTKARLTSARSWSSKSSPTATVSA